MAGDLFNTRFVDCHFNGTIFLSLRGVKMDLNKRGVELTWNAMHLKMYGPKTNTSEQEVRKIVHNQFIVNKLSDVFVDTKK